MSSDWKAISAGAVQTHIHRLFNS